jgi:hypothetical protein
MREGRGSADAVNNLKTSNRNPAFTFNENFALKHDALKERVLEALKATVIRQTLPEVAVKQQFHIGPETDIRIFNLCPRDDNTVHVSYELRGDKEDALRNVFDWSGKFLTHGDRKKYAGKSTAQARGNRKGSVGPYKNGDCIYTLSKSQREALITLNYSASRGEGDVESAVVLSSDPYKEKRKALCTLAIPGPQRAFDVDASQQYITVLQDTPRNIHLYKFSQKQPVVTYTPPYTYCRPSDVCFFKLRDEEVLLVADEGTNSIHVLRVQDGTLTFLRYLAPGCPLLMQPTALNTDHTGQLWVACKGGVILTMKPVTQ